MHHNILILINSDYIYQCYWTFLKQLYSSYLSKTFFFIINI